MLFASSFVGAAGLTSKISSWFSADGLEGFKRHARALAPKPRFRV